MKKYILVICMFYLSIQAMNRSPQTHELSSDFTRMFGEKQETLDELLFKAIKNDNPREVINQLNKGASFFSARTKDLSTPLHFALHLDKPAILRILLESVPSVNYYSYCWYACDSSGESAYELAEKKGLEYSALFTEVAEQKNIDLIKAEKKRHS
jgi:ankyrin repeat protein